MSFANILLCVVKNYLAKSIEQTMCIMQPWRCFRVILNTENRMLFVLHPFNPLVVQVDLRDFHIARFQALRIHPEPALL